MHKLFDTCRVFLDIKKPIHFEFRERIYKNCAGVHWTNTKGDKIIKHIIKISYNQLNEERNFETVLAHEFVHAWQAEYKPFKKVAHNKTFVNRAKELETFLSIQGFKVKDIFNPDIDKA
jgi:hypothetical protein